MFGVKMRQEKKHGFPSPAGKERDFTIFILMTLLLFLLLLASLLLVAEIYVSTMREPDTPTIPTASENKGNGNWQEQGISVPKAPDEKESR